MKNSIWIIGAGDMAGAYASVLNDMNLEFRVMAVVKNQRQNLKNHSILVSIGVVYHQQLNYLDLLKSYNLRWDRIACRISEKFTICWN